MSPRSFLALICYAASWATSPNIAHAMPEAAAAGGDAAAASQSATHSPPPCAPATYHSYCSPTSSEACVTAAAPTQRSGPGCGR